MPWFKSSNPKLKGRVFETEAEMKRAEDRLGSEGGKMVDYADTSKETPQRPGESNVEYVARRKKAESAKMAKKEGQKKALQ